MNHYIYVLKNYFKFSGRARRAEYWYFILFNIIVSIVLGFIDGALGMMDYATGFGLLSGLYALGIIIPSLAVAVRRLHDTDRSGWWILIMLIPVIGFFIFLYFMIQGSKPDNRFGPNPIAAEGAA